MERNITTLAVVLQSRRWGELHRKVSLLTPELGIVDVLVYGARKGRQAGKAERFLTGRFFLYYNPVRQEYSLVDVEPLAAHEALGEDLRRVWAASFCVELILRTGGGESLLLFLLLTQTLDLLSDGAVVDRVLIQYVWKLLHIAGNAAGLESCPVCDRLYEPDEILGFSLSLLAPCCRSCAGEGDEMILPPGARRYLALTEKLEMPEAVSVELSEAAQQRIKAYMLRYASLFAGGGLKTLAAGVL